ncbi:Ribosomal protein S35, mitochondrial [Phaffia rhodozyma]|uniref:Ribosomal protein S35, mitochondrial n=1 Tax=Phaffia rhodozyma TaxID=264483 RepID=A0A0F7SF63_PHARH|nr:Ribosomal protein S35, mitochondrial [Phaffia rhodozyma]
MIPSRTMLPLSSVCGSTSTSSLTKSLTVRLGSLSLSRKISSSSSSSSNTSTSPQSPIPSASNNGGSFSAGYLGRPIKPIVLSRMPGGFYSKSNRSTVKMSEATAREEFQKWCQTTGAEFKWPKPRTRNWLGGTRPYPANPYFKPTPPLSCDLQEEIYQLYKSFPGEVGAVERMNLLSEKYSISKERVTGAIKTGQVGEAWAKVGQPPQRPFVRGMESYLCVPEHNVSTTHESQPRSNAAVQFTQYLGSRIDIERDLETEKLETGERSHRFEDSGFDPATVKSLGQMSWEMVRDGEQALTSKIALEKPLRPPPAFPVFPNKVVKEATRSPVWNFVDVGGKFNGLAWDGALGRKGHCPPSPMKAIKQFIPLVKTRSGPYDPFAKQKADRVKRAARAARKEALNAAGELTPHQKIVAKMTPADGGLPVHLVHQDIMVRKAKYREEKKANKYQLRVQQEADKRAEFKRMVKAKIEGLD